MSKRVSLAKIRCCFVTVKTPKAFDGDAPKYSVQLMVDKNDPQIKAIQNTIVEVAKDYHGKDVKIASLKLPLRDGDTERDEAYYNNVWFINANKGPKKGEEVPSKPVVKGPMKEDIVTDEQFDRYMYSGAYFNVIVSFYGFKGRQKGVACGLEGIMFAKDGERLDGSLDAGSAFDDFADGEGDTFGDSDVPDTSNGVVSNEVDEDDTPW